MCLGSGDLACSALFWEEECASYLMNCTVIVTEFVCVSYPLACGRVCLVFMSRILVISKEAYATIRPFRVLIYSEYI